MGLELHAETSDPPVHDEGTTRVELGCEGQVARIEVLDPLTGKTLARKVSFARFPPQARSRLLALAVAELVSASWIELETNPTPAVEPVAPPVRPEEKAVVRETVRERVAFSPPQRSPLPPLPPPAVRAPARDARAWRLQAEVGVRGLAVDASPLVGLGGRLTLDPATALGVDLDVLGEHSTSTVALGTVALDAVSVGAAMRLRSDWGHLTLHGGPGVRLGYARIAGAPISPATAVGHEVDGAWGAPIGQLGVDYVTASRLTVGLTVESGYVVLPVRGVVQGGRDVRMDGFFAGATLSAGWAF